VILARRCSPIPYRPSTASPVCNQSPPISCRASFYIVSNERDFPRDIFRAYGAEKTEGGGVTRVASCFLRGIDLPDGDFGPRRVGPIVKRQGRAPPRRRTKVSPYRPADSGYRSPGEVVASTYSSVPVAPDRPRPRLLRSGFPRATRLRRWTAAPPRGMSSRCRRPRRALRHWRVGTAGFPRRLFGRGARERSRFCPLGRRALLVTGAQRRPSSPGVAILRRAS